MYRKVCSFVSVCVSKLRGMVSHVALLGVLAFHALCFSAFAQSGNSIEVMDAQLEWSTVPSQVVGSLIEPMVVAVGIAIGVWVVIAGVRFFRRAAS